LWSANAQLRLWSLAFFFRRFCSCVPKKGEEEAFLKRRSRLAQEGVGSSKSWVKQA